jgi:cytidine deaminase
MTKKELCDKAVEMIAMAYCPYSHFPVGAALECDDGAVYTGCNIENAGYTPTNCAERTAVFKAVSEGHRKFRRIAIAATTEKFCAPCGVCRQVLSEFDPELQMEVILVNASGKTLELTLKDLVPYSFDSSYLG